MASRKSASIDTTEALKLIDEWRNKWALNEDPYLRGIEGALAQRRELAFWLSLDPDLYLPTNFENSPPSVKRLGLVKTIRNGLIFAPVAFTWFAVSQATAGFSRYNAVDGNHLVNFLTFWQQPSPYLSALWTIGNTGIIDGTLIIAIGLLTVLEGFLQSAIQKREFQIEQSFFSERKSLCLEICRVSGGAFAKDFDALSRSLNASTQALNMASNKLEKNIEVAKGEFLLIPTPNKSKPVIRKFFTEVMKKINAHD